MREKKKIANNIYFIKPSLDYKYFYIETLKQLFKLFNRKKLIKEFIKKTDLQNQKVLYIILI